MATWELPDRLCDWATARMGNITWEMCIYHQWEVRDTCISKAVARGAAWEPALTGTMLRTLFAHRAERARLIDIGANIGFYTLAAGAAGFDVHAFEPVPRNAAMLQMSLERNGLEKRVRLAVCGFRCAAPLMGRATNQGGGATSTPCNAAPRLCPWQTCSPRSPGRLRQDDGGRRVRRACATSCALIVGWQMEMKQ